MAFAPGVHTIESYGGGGFRFAGMSHRGSIVATPRGVHGWHPARVVDIDPRELADLLGEGGAIDIVLIGLGTAPGPLPDALAGVLAHAGFRRCDAMTTSAAASTYNVLVAEGRRVAAALIAVP